MPQTPNDWWINEFDADPDEYKHRIGNLTLTTLNSELGNKTFDEKKEKYEKDPFLVTRKLCEFGSWKCDDINRRSLMIAQKLIGLFPIPKKYSTPEYQAKFELKQAAKANRTTFHAIGIPVGSVLAFIHDNTITCTVADSINQVEYGGKRYAISTAAKAIKDSLGGSVNASYNGFDWFMYDGIKLTERRRRIESGEIDITGASDI